MASPVRIVGSYISPYVRKVLVVLDLKGLQYEIDPIVPFLGDDRFSQLSPLRRIPVLVDDRVTLTDSTVICEYLEDRYPSPALFPADPVARARARWLEEFADTRIGEVLIWRLFNQLIINPFVWRTPTDEQILQKTLTEDIPHVLTYLESQLPADGLLFGPLSVADIAIACPFRNAGFARFAVDAERWPKTAAFVARVLAHESFQKLTPYEDKMMRTPLPKHRDALTEMGAPLTAESYGTAVPRRGLMQI
jgi:glutathione S-transferase